MTADEMIQAAADVLDVHRWKSMGISSVECECGEILDGNASLTQFPADEAFRRHMAEAFVAAVEPLIRADQDSKWVAELAALCDDDWLRKRDRCMDLHGASTRRSRTAAGAWEHAAHMMREVLVEHGYDYDDPRRHDSYLKWMRGGRDQGEEERKIAAGGDQQ